MACYAKPTHIFKIHIHHKFPPHLGKPAFLSNLSSYFGKEETLASFSVKIMSDFYLVGCRVLNWSAIFGENKYINE